MKRLLEILSAEERTHFDRSLDPSSAATEQVRERVRDARDFLERSTWMSDEAEVRWRGAEAHARFRILSEIIWRTNCVMEKSETAVIGIRKFSLGYGFSLSHTEINDKDAFVVV